jgi:transposase
MRKYDDEFKREAVRKIHDGQSVASVARELGCAESPLHRWKRDAFEVSSGSEREVLVLKKRVRELEMERDILKKAALIFGRSGWFATVSLRTRSRTFHCGCYAG